MDHRQELRQAQLGLIDIVKNLKSEDLDVASNCSDWTIRDILKHVTQNAYAVVATGKGEDYDAESDKRLDNDLREEFPRAADAAWEVNQREDVLEGTIQFGGAERPKWVQVSFQFADIFIHQWDIRRSLSQPITLSPELVNEALKVAAFIPEGDQVRGPGKPFGHVVPIDSDDPQDKLLALTGRDPSWAPAAA